MCIYKQYFLKLESLCPAFHADVYYYLSLIYYMEKNDCEAVKYFNKFLEFPTENKKQIAINYKDQKLYVEASLEMSQYFCDFYKKDARRTMTQNGGPMSARDLSDGTDSGQKTKTVKKIQKRISKKRYWIFSY